MKITISLGQGERRTTANSPNPDEIWIPPGRSVTIGRDVIAGGMLYVGKCLAAVSGWRGVEPALIDPALPISAFVTERADTTLPYWPSYSEISPACRGAYLHWLASGRDEPSANIGYIFLFYYGLERRLLADTRQSEMARGEADTILMEIGRLLQVYGEDRSFRSYASALIDSMRASKATHRLYNSPPPSVRLDNKLPDVLRVALGQLAADRRPVPADWAWSWLACHPEVYFRTPAKRCAEPFRKLFDLRYKQQFGDGLAIIPCKTKLMISYRPASPSFGESVTLTAGELSDVTSIGKPFQKLKDLAEQCTNELDAYSRWLGRNPDGQASMSAVALIPKDLLAQNPPDELRHFQEWLSGKVGTGDAFAKIDAIDLIRLWDVGSYKLAKADAVGLAQVAEKFGFGFEPDVRFGGAVLEADMEAIVFRISEHAATAPSPAYSAATLGLHLSAAVASVDGTVSEEETRHLEESFEATLHFSAHERLRLRAHLAWLLASRPGMTGLKKRVEGLSEPQRRGVAGLLVAVAGADGRFDPTEITMLTKIYKLLGFTAAEVYSDVHGHATIQPAAEPVTVRSASAGQSGFTIPPPPRPTEGALTGKVDLNMDRIAAKLAETAAVAALLHNVFTDDAPATVAAPRLEAPPAVNGLDAAHSTLARELARRASWARAEIETMTAKLKLMPDGALEKVNDAAFDRCGEAFCEGDDPIEINATVALELLG